MDDLSSEDSRFQIDPQNGTNCAIVVVDMATGVVDEAVAVDKRNEVRIAAGRPQPPPAIAAIDGFVGALSITVYRTLTLSRTVRTEVFVNFGNAEEEYFVGRVTAS